MGVRPRRDLAGADHQPGLGSGTDELPAAGEIRRRGRVLRRRRPDRRGAGLGMCGDRNDARNQRARGGARAARRLGEDQGRVPRNADRGPEARVVLPDRTRRRLGRVGHAHHRRAQGDKYVINGSKVFITNGGYADWYTVYAKTDKDAGHRGISAFVVPRDDTVTVDKHEDKMGLRASNTAGISFNDTEVPAQNLLGDENHGFKLAMMTLDRTRPGVAAMATGIARAAFEFATEYSKQRVQFGVPIAMHQAIQFMIADMATEVEASRLLAWQSAVLLDQGKRNTLQSSHAKRFAADTAMKVATDAVQIYGGYGFIKDYPVEKLMRDAKIMQLYEGTSQIQRLVIAREILLPRAVEQPPVARELAAAA